MALSHYIGTTLWKSTPFSPPTLNSSNGSRILPSSWTHGLLGRPVLKLHDLQMPWHPGDNRSAPWTLYSKKLPVLGLFTARLELCGSVIVSKECHPMAFPPLNSYVIGTVTRSINCFKSYLCLWHKVSEETNYTILDLPRCLFTDAEWPSAQSFVKIWSYVSLYLIWPSSLCYFSDSARVNISTKFRQV